MKIILQAIKSLFRGVSRRMTAQGKRIDKAQSTADTANKRANNAQTAANNAFPVRVEIDIIAKTASLTGKKIQELVEAGQYVYAVVDSDLTPMQLVKVGGNTATFVNWTYSDSNGTSVNWEFIEVSWTGKVSAISSA